MQKHPFKKSKKDMSKKGKETCLKQINNFPVLVKRLKLMYKKIHVKIKPFKKYKNT